MKEESSSFRWRRSQESNSITFIDGVSIIFLFTFPIYLVHFVIPDFKNDFQMLINIIGYFLFTIILFLGMYGIEKIFTKNNSKNIYEKKDFDEVIEKSFFKIPATKEILKKVKYTYGTEKMLSLLEENNGNITNEDIRNIISEEEKNNKYKDIVDSL